MYRNFDVSVEGGWFQNAVTRRVAGLTSPLTTFLQQSQGATATAVVKMPTAYFAVNGRWVFENQGRFRPYAVVGVGDARTTLKSSFALAGADITSSLGQYGVTLGSDLTRQTSHAAINAGAGVLVPLGKWFADAGLRVTSIRTAGQATNVVRFNIGGFARF